MVGQHTAALAMGLAVSDDTHSLSTCARSPQRGPSVYAWFERHAARPVPLDRCVPYSGRPRRFKLRQPDPS